MMSLEGQQIGRYRLLQLLGSGGMGDVYLAEDARIEQQVAIKVIRSEVSPYPNSEATQEAARLFQREAKAIARLDHPNILPLFDYGEERISSMNLTYLVMPYRQEGSLADWLGRRASREVLSPAEVAHILRQAADALQHAHDHQLIHQDVKPSNFLIRSRKESPTRPEVLLTDFGIARFTTATSSVSQAIRGTPAYMAPEQWEGQPVPATDQYALAVLAYELLTGRPPFQGGLGHIMYQHLHVEPVPPSMLNPHLSAEIDQVLLHALAKHPEQRFASISAFAHAFFQAAEDKDNEHAPTLSAPLHPAASTPRQIAALPIIETLATTAVASGPSLATPITATHTQLASSSGSLSTASSSGSFLPPGLAATALPTLTRPLPPTQQRGRRRFVLIPALVLLLLLVVGGIAFAMAGVFPSAARTLHNGTSSRPGTVINRGGTTTNAPNSLSNVLGSVSKAIVTITPAQANLNKTYTILAVTGSANASQQQVQARVLSSTTATYSETVNATGTTQIPAVQATGTLTVSNFAKTPLTFAAGTILPDDNNSSIEVQLDSSVTAPAYPQTNGYAYVSIHVIPAGTIGNLPKQNKGVFYHCTQCNSNTSGYEVYNDTNFSGGQNAQSYTSVQQSDIDNAASALEQANTPNAEQLLQSQVQANERFAGTPHCTPQVSANHHAGDRVSSVTVSVSFTCSGEVYDQAGALSLAANLLSAQAANNPGSGYTLSGNIATTVTSATANGGTITLTVSARGIWIFQFSTAQQQALARLIAGKKEQAAQALLLQQRGVGQAVIQLSGGDGHTLPTDLHQITIVVHNA